MIHKRPQTTLTLISLLAILLIMPALQAAEVSVVRNITVVTDGTTQADRLELPGNGLTFSVSGLSITANLVPDQEVGQTNTVIKSYHYRDSGFDGDFDPILKGNRLQKATFPITYTYLTSQNQRQSDTVQLTFSSIERIKADILNQWNAYPKTFTDAERLKTIMQWLYQQGVSLKTLQQVFPGQEAYLAEAYRQNPPLLAISNQILRLDYPGFTLWLDCAQRGAIKFQYVAQRDSGANQRYDQFFSDPIVPEECQQTSTRAYGAPYDRGHLVPANHMDASDAAIKATNTMTNILPQAANMNRGTWLQTEEIVECYRDIDELLVIGGVIWGNNPVDDYFVATHGVKTPDAFWKLVIRGGGQDERVIAWVVPNAQSATRKNLDQYLVSVDELEQAIGEAIPVADYAKHDKPSQSWIVPVGCNKG